MPSLRRRVITGTAFASACVVLTAGIALFAVMRSSLISDFDKALLEKASTLAALIEQDADGIDLEFTEADMIEFNRPDRPEYFQVWREDGTVVARSPSLAAHDLPRIHDYAKSVDFRACDLPDGRPGRIVNILATTRLDDETDPSLQPTQLLFAYARDVQDVNATLARLLMLLLGIGLLTIVTITVALALVVHAGLRPIDRVAHEIGEIDEQQLATQIDTADVPRELSPIVIQLNSAMERLDKAFTREKMLTANVAHELRTPLAGLRSMLEVALSRERDAASYRDTMSSALTIIEQTQRLVANLLVLARLDAQHKPDASQRTHVESLLRDTWTPFQPRAREKQLDVTWSIEPELVATTNCDQLSLVLANLYDNAVCYTYRGGCISIASSRENDTLKIRITNANHEIESYEIERVFDRFWRGESVRGDSGIHSGLGLSICKSTIQQLGGAITAHREPQGQFSVEVLLHAP